MACAANTDGWRYVIPVTSRPMRTRSVTPVSAASVVTPSKHSPGPSPYIGWKWSKPHTPSNPSDSANCARETTSAHGIRCCAMSSPNCIRPCYHAPPTPQIVIRVAKVAPDHTFATLMANAGASVAGSAPAPDRCHHAAQVVGREGVDDGVDRGAGGRRPAQAEERRELAEVIAGSGPLHEV